MSKTIYLQLEDDLRRITKLLEDEKANDLILVFPKRSYLFGDSLNLRLLKKHADLLNKNITVMTADERGQVYARDAGFAIRQVKPEAISRLDIGDIRLTPKASVPEKPAPPAYNRPPLAKPTTRGIDHQNPISEPSKNLHKPKGHALSHQKIHPRPAVARPMVKDTVFPDVSGVTELLSQKKVKRPARYTGWIAAVGIGIITGCVLGGLVVLPKATVAVETKAELLSRNFEISVRPGAQNQSAQLILNGQTIDKTLQASGKFPVEGKREVGSKARGKIKIVNLTGLPLTLRAGTTTLTSGNRRYKLVVDQAAIPPIPASQALDQSVGQEAEIVAIDAGTNLNLPAGTRLEISNQVFGSRPQVLFARTLTEITGGNSRFVSVISENDLSKAREGLVANLFKNLENEVNNSNLAVSRLASRTEILEFATDKPVGSEVPVVEATLKARVRTVAFSKTSLANDLRTRMEKLAPPDKHLQEPGLDLIEYQPQGLPDEQGNTKLLVQYQTKMLTNIDSKKITGLVRGATLKDAEAKLSQMPDITNAKIDINPPWLSRLPLFAKRIFVEIK